MRLVAESSNDHNRDKLCEFIATSEGCQSNEGDFSRFFSDLPEILDDDEENIRITVADCSDDIRQTSLDNSGRKTLKHYQTSMAETHLEWMTEAMPQETERLYRAGKLKDRLNRVVERAEALLDQLTDAGRREDEALEVVTANILAPEIPYEEDEDGNPKHRIKMRPKVREEIVNNILRQ